MPTSAWCDECKSWVWVGPDGGCASGGHPASALRGHYEAELPSGVQPDMSDQFGVGDVPAEVNSFNWGAFIVVPLWALVHGAWQVVLMWIGVLAVPFMVSFALGVIVVALGGRLEGPVLIVATLLGEAVIFAMRLYAAMNGGRIAWENDRKRLATGRRKPRSSVAKYLADQRTWMLAGFIIAGVFTPISSYTTYLQWRDQFGMGLVGAALTGGVFLVEIALGYIVYRMRKEAA